MFHLESRPGMGGSYRSSSSSGYRSSSHSSYRSSHSSSSYKSSSSSSSYTSTGSSISSLPEPTAYFKSSNHKIKIHFKADGKAIVNERMDVISDTAKVGIIRKKFPVLSNWKILQATVIPDTYRISDYNWELDVHWPEETNKAVTPVELSYELEKGVDSIGNIPIVYWEINKNSAQIEGSEFEISWDPEIHWKSFQLQQKYYDSFIYKSITKPIALIKSDNKVSVNFSSAHPDYSSLIITAFPESLPNVSLANENSDRDATKEFYRVKQTSYIGTNRIDRHEGTVDVLQSTSSEWDRPHLDFNAFDYSPGSTSMGRSTSLFSPTYQFVFGIEGDLETSFWHLFSGQLISDRMVVDEKNRNFKTNNITFQKLGEHSQSPDGNREIIRFYPFNLGAFSSIKLNSLNMEIVLPKETNQEKTSVKVFLSKYDSLSHSPEGTIELPIGIIKNDNRYTINWTETFPDGYLPLIQIETETTPFYTNPFLVYFSALRFFFIAPGSGSNIGYLASFGLLLISPFIIIFLFLKKAKEKVHVVQSHIATIHKIKKNDPDFQEDDFFAKTKFIGEKIVESWSSGNMEPVRHFISAGVFQRFQIQLKLLKEIDGNKNLMKDFKIDHQSIIGFDSSGDYQTVHLMLNCSAKDITVPISVSEPEIERKFKHANIGSYREIYSFSRKTSAATQIGKDLIHNQCPSCGGDTNASHITTKCQYCGNIFNSGECDWVLSEITQEVEWNPNRFIDNESFVQKYPDCPTSVQLLEDRASALLWKWIYAKSLGDETILKREVANESLLKKSKQKEVFYIPVIGSAEMQNLNKENGSFRTDCNFRWSASRSSNAIPEHKRNTLKLILNTTRDAKLGFSESACKNCGAPYPEVDATHCIYCKEPIPEIVNDWLLYDIS